MSRPRPIGNRRATVLVMRREVRQRLVSRPFVVGLVVTVAVIFGAFGIVSLVSGEDPVRIGLVGAQPDGAVDNLRRLADLTDTDVRVTYLADRAAAEQALDDDDLDAVVVDGTDLVVTDTEGTAVALVGPAWQQAALVANLADEGFAEGQIDAALAAAQPPRVHALDADADDGQEGVAFFSVVLLFIAIQIAGTYIMMGVFEEKSTKVVELVLSSVRARDLLLGKIVGVGVLGVIQVLVLAGAALAAAAVFSSAGVPGLSPTLLATALVWFVLGYLLYGSVFAAGASLAPRQEDAQSTLGPVSVVLVLSYFGAIFSASDPASPLARIVSWLPITAPFAMPGRIASGDAAWWEVAGSMAVTAVAAAAVLLLAERIYVRSIIHTDRKLGWREAWSLGA